MRAFCPHCFFLQQVIKEYLHAETDEDKTGDDVGRALGDGDVALAEINANHGDHEGDNTDEGHNPEDGGQRVVQSQPDTDGEGIDAGRHAEKEEIEN